MNRPDIGRVGREARRRGLAARYGLRNLVRRAPVTGTAPYTVTLTSYGPRVRRVHLALESIGAGTTRPHRLILWLDDAGTVATPPRALRRLRRRGLEIRHCADLGPHKKYYPYVRGEAGDRVESGFVTADDDVFYPPSWLAVLVRGADRWPGTILCHRARVMGVGPGGITPYAAWPLCATTDASRRNVPTGVGGVLYPARVTDLLRRAGDGFRRAAPSADDLWIHRVALTGGVRARQVHADAWDFPAVPGSQTTALYITNAEPGGPNDAIVAALYSAADVAGTGARPGTAGVTRVSQASRQNGNVARWQKRW